MFDINKVLNAEIGTLPTNIRVEFKKTVPVKQYETEAVSDGVEMSTEGMDGMDRAMIYALLEVQAEYTVIANLAIKGLITQQAFTSRVQALETYINQMSARYSSITGRDAEKKFGTVYQNTQVPSSTEAGYVQQQVQEMPKLQTQQMGQAFQRNGWAPQQATQAQQVQMGAYPSGNQQISNGYNQYPYTR